MPRKIETGKLPADILTRLLSRTRTDPRVIIGPAYGEDAAAVRFAGGILVAATDPITFATDRVGQYAVDVNANDIAVMGGVPRHFLATILLPPGSSESDVQSIFDDIEQACQAINVTLIGGHTEITSSVNSVVISGCMLGEVDEESLISNKGARVGDALLLAGPIAVEGTAILANEPIDGIKSELIERAKYLLDDPGIGVLRYARIAMNNGGVTAMHDPTEGGLATAIRELAGASEKGAIIQREAIPVLEECRVICDVVGLNPLGLIASGSLLIAADSGQADQMLARFEEAGVIAAEIGTITEPETGIRFAEGEEVPAFDRDEIARYFDS
ncbi:MAG: AIR synthase family protein [Armatimonadota bacterium]|jgi:hydrogenase expression/formation protein HypE